MGSEKRRHDRYYVRLPVDLVVGKTKTSAMTVDVSFGGLFLKTARPPPPRQLVKVTLLLPPKDREVSLMAMAVFVEGHPDDHGMRGVGLKLFGLDDDLQERWEEFVKHVRTIPRTEKVPEGQAEKAPTDEDSGAWSNLLPELRIRTRTRQDLRNILNLEIRKGRMYVRTPVELPPQSGVELHLVHPDTSRTFSFVGEVDRKVKENGFVGLRILLPPFDGAKVKAFQRFVESDAVMSIDVDSDDLERNEDLDADRSAS